MPNIRQKCCIYLVCIAVFGCTFFVNNSIVGAADKSQDSSPQGVSISPPIREITVEAGRSYDGLIKLSNPSQAIVELYPVSMDFGSEGESGKPKFYNVGEGNTTFSLSNWITVSQPKIAIAPQQVVSFAYSINIPADAEPGGHYGVLFFSTKPPESVVGSSQVSISSMIGCLFLVKVEGKTTEFISLKDFIAPRIVFTPKINIQTRIVNTGNIHIKPLGEINIDNQLTGNRQNIEFNDIKGNILPMSARLFENLWAPLPWLNIGPNKIQLNLIYGENQQALNSSRTVWFLPWYVFVILAVLLIALYMGIKKITKKRKKDFNKFFKVPG